MTKTSNGTGSASSRSGNRRAALNEPPTANHELRQLKDFASRVIRWQRVHGRHDLPWQATRDAYRIWVSEIMLQQTQVSAVIPYYLRFVERFPDVQSLAEASEDSVLARWSGLGYYARGRNLHRAARLIVERHAGVFPRAFEAVCALPGVGRSTAAAICVFVFGQRRAILDGNVKRVLARHDGIAGYPGNSAVRDRLWLLAEARLPERDVRRYTQGLMDLGAGLCTRRKPDCVRCPLAQTCVALRDGLTEQLPAPRPGKRLPQRETAMLILLNAGEVLLEKRPASGIWGGLWSFPEVGEGEIERAALIYGARSDSFSSLAPVEHGFTHFKLRILPFVAHVARELRAEQPGRLWVPLDDALTAPIPAPIRRILGQLRANPPSAASQRDLA